jgi:hypothetical protein
MFSNWHVACPFKIVDLPRAKAFSGFLGKSAADENNPHRTIPRSLRNPSMSMPITFSCDSVDCARTPIWNNKTPMIPAMRIDLVLTEHLLAIISIRSQNLTSQLQRVPQPSV